MQILRHYNPHGVIGWCPELGLWTIERPWKDNQTGVSCIPEGRYELTWHEPTGVSLPDGWTGTWALINQNLSVSYMPRPNMRSYILLHVANYVDDIEGCIGWGDNHIIHDDRLMVTNSRDATAEMMDYIDAEGIQYIDISAWRPQ